MPWPNFPKRTGLADSDQATPRHTKGLTYRCFLPDLAGFISLCCARPNPQHHLIRPDLRKSAASWNSILL